jgi:hypothetical protein
MVIKRGGREMPEETKYTKEEVEAYEVALALSASDMHFRFKMKRLAERSLVPETGRALGNNYHIRVDKFGNPEILYNRSVVARFTVDGLRLSQENVSAYDKTIQNMFNSLVNLYTEYRFENYGLGSLMLKDIHKVADDAGYEQHNGYSKMGDGCVICKEYEALFDEIKKKTDKLNADYKAFVDSKRVTFKRGDENELIAFPLLPYKPEIEKTLPEFINRAYEDMKTKRGWKRKEK